MSANTNSTDSVTTVAKTPWHRRLYDWVLHWANTPYGLTALVLISFAESSFFPIPPDVLLMPLVLAAPRKWWKIAGICTIASVFGGMVGYGIGVFAWESIGKAIVEGMLHVNLVEVNGRMDIALPAYLTEYFGATLGGQYLFEVYDVWNAWIIGIFGLTPLPYKLVTITAGVAKVDFGVFILASIAARGFRFFAVALILGLVGEPAKAFIDRNFNLLTVVFVLLLIGGFAVVKLAF
jgi:membrane protein YqaA with SNARE-associated domain